MRFEVGRFWGTVQDSLGITSAAWIGMNAIGQGRRLCSNYEIERCPTSSALYSYS